ncbi:glucose 1-dehydrogenase [Mesorhizobium sp. BH1-1-5]|uniref:SDR family NAD(P)-dependent oxidoreductase n=1 Tax=unclassified Mesorhizobium TaxID=325217 RepID=UPI001CCDD586|nr:MULTISPECIES: glucose 1-dehydrogenase [unclassified Mesorhizobium]MBZ9988992.1 glucose 1-dehydrogenase [Mesorhizobium sp. BH1-1-5]
MMTVQELFSLTGKVALITGGGRGIGKEAGLLLSNAGAGVAVLDRDGDAAVDAAAAITAQGGNALALTADISSPEQVSQAFGAAVAHFGRLDILVNNAALVRRTPALETSMEVWREVMEVNLNAAFNCSCRAAEEMTKAGGGAIVNIASIMGVSGGGIYPIASYHASKGGLINLTRGLAVEWAPRGIRVNAVAPTWVRTEFTKALLDDPQMSKTLLDLMPMRAFADTADVAAAVLYLASPAAKIVTGHVLAVDGGYLAR